MNSIVLRGYLRDIQFSHYQGDIEYEKANLICPRGGGQEEDIISLRYKRFVNRHQEGDFVEIRGNLRSYSTKVNDKNNVQIYVFTYFDSPEEINVDNTYIDGRICRINTLSYDNNGLPHIHFILANNIFTNNGKKINSYIPCTAYGEEALRLANCRVNDFLTITGNLHSHCYTMEKADDKEFRIAHELIVKAFDKKDE